MAGWHLSGQARQALRTARDLARGRRASGSADPLLAAILGQWDDERAGGPALLRARGLTAGQAGQIADTLLPAPDAEPGAEPRVIGGLRFVLDQAQLGSLSATEQVEAIDPLEELEVPTPAAAMLGELARQQATSTRWRGTGASPPCTTCSPC